MTFWDSNSDIRGTRDQVFAGISTRQHYKGLFQRQTPIQTRISHFQTVSGPTERFAGFERVGLHWDIVWNVETAEGASSKITDAGSHESSSELYPFNALGIGVFPSYATVQISSISNSSTPAFTIGGGAL